MTSPPTRRLTAMLAGAIVVTAFGIRPARIAVAQTMIRGEIGARLDTLLRRSADFGFAGAAVVSKNGEVILAQGYGDANRSTGTPITVETPFFLGSIAKQFTAAAVLRLEADGKLSRTDSLGRFFPTAPADKRSITVEQLLRHTSGLPYLPSAGLFGPGSRDAVMDEMLRETLDSRPGERYGYSSPGYTLLAGIIERVSGTSYEQFLTDRLFTPAGLTSTGFIGDSVRWRGTDVVAYSDGVAQLPLADIPAFPRAVGAGSVIGTVQDLHRWQRALVTGTILQKPQLDALFEPVVEIGGATRGGMAWSIIPIPQGVLRLAAGDIGGYNAELRDYHPEDIQIAFASTVRSGGRGFREILVNALARITRGETVPMPPALDRKAGRSLGQLAGTWTVPGGKGRLTAQLVGDTLWLGANDAEGVAVLAPTDSALATAAAQADERTRAFIEALRQPGSADSMVHPSIPADGREQVLSELRGLLAGPGAPAALLGSTAATPVEVRSWLRAAGSADGAGSVVMLTWLRGRLVGFQGGLPLADRIALRPEGPGRAVAFDPFTGRTMRARLHGQTLAVDKGPAPVELVRARPIDSPGGRSAN